MHIRTAISACLLALTALAVQAQTQTTTSRLYLFNPDSNDIKNSVDGLVDAIKSRGRPAKRLGLIPTTLPDKLGEPVASTVRFGPMTLRTTECGDAYGEISIGSSTDGGMLGSSGEKFFGCIYLAKNGIRLSLILEQSTSSSGSLMGSLLTGIRDGIRGDDQKFGRETFDKMTAQVREKVPGILVELVEITGDISRPDGDKVAKLLARSNAPAPEALVAAPVAEAAPAIKPIANGAQIVEARKQLTNMGLQYFSIDQFHEAIVRKDEMAVQLFVQAGAVKASAASAKGQTGLQLAKASGDAEILAMLERTGK